MYRTHTCIYCIAFVDQRQVSLQELAIFALHFLSSFVENGAHGGTVTKGKDGVENRREVKAVSVTEEKRKGGKGRGGRREGKRGGGG